MSNTITATTALNLLEEVVREKGGDYVYPNLDRCIYFDDEGAPSCIVGHVLAKLGAIEGDLKSKIGPGIKVNEALLTSLIIDGIELEEDAMNLLRAAQRKQDEGSTWGAAVSKARYWAPVAA